MKGRYILVFLRAMIGLVYIISGAEKLLQPYENFLYIIQEYEIIPIPAMERGVAWLFPWLELFLGGFLLLGLWTRESLTSVGIFSLVFIITIGQAIIRGLPLAECGCFGDLVDLPLAVTLMLDILIFFLVIPLLYFYDGGTSWLSLDRFWEKKEEHGTENDSFKS